MGAIDSGGGLGSSDMDGMSKDQFDSFANVVEATQGDFYSSPNQELDIGAELDDIDPDADLIDFSNPTRDGATPLGEAGPGFDFNKLSGGQGSGPKPLGSSGNLKLADDGLVGAKGFGRMESPYAAPKYYTPQGSVEFQKMVSGLLSNVFGSSIRKPTIRSLI